MAYTEKLKMSQGDRYAGMDILSVGPEETPEDFAPWEG